MTKIRVSKSNQKDQLSDITLTGEMPGTGMIVSKAIPVDRESSNKNY